jgi:hypothetical protein
MCQGGQASCTGGPLNGLCLTNGYDEFLRRTNLAVLNSTTPLLQHSFGYDPASRLQAATNGPDARTGVIPSEAK